MSIQNIRCIVGALLAVFLLLGPGSASAQIYTLPRADTSAGMAFGADVAIDGNFALVGASGENVCGPNSGAAYIYRRGSTPGTWRQVAHLTPSQCDEGSFFGRSLDLSGNRAIVSASSEFFASRKSNAAYIFERDSAGTWTEQARITAKTEYQEGAFAASVAIDGNQALITTSGSSEGNYGGAAYFYDYDPATDGWTQSARLTAQADVEYGVLGGACALDGNHAAVAASTYFAQEPGSVYIFERDTTGTWHESGRIGEVDDFFIAVDLSGTRLLVGEARAGGDRSGEATVHERTASGTWTRTATLRPSEPYESGAFGSAVSLDGDRALVTGYDEQLGQDYNIDRVVYTFQHESDQHESEADAWTPRQIIDLGEVAFGAALDHHSNFAIISSVPDDEPGTVYIVQLY